MNVQNILKRKKAGLPPGSLVYSGPDRKGEKVTVRLIEYNETEVIKEEVTDAQRCIACLGSKYTSWISFNGFHEVKKVKEICQSLSIHDLTIEDILNTNQRPKIEVNNDYIFVTLKLIQYDQEDETFDKEQISIILKKGVILSLQEHENEALSDVRKRIINDKGHIRHKGADYLLYSILDSIIDRYIVVVDHLQFELEELEERALIDSDADFMHEIQWLKKEILHIRRAVSPVKEIILILLREDTTLISSHNHIYLRDVYDHTNQVQDGIETIRDILSGLVDTHQANMSNKMNEIMKYLTVFTSIFTPLTFMTGVFGMNFANMPGLNWEFGFYAMWLLMFGVGLTLFIVFKRKRWL